jgi:Peptidyl-prolyl cis-trans isomerase (rotamase) - cyclophilin family
MKKYIVALAIAGLFAACQAQETTATTESTPAAPEPAATSTEAISAADTTATTEPSATVATTETTATAAIETVGMKKEEKKMTDPKNAVAEIHTTSGTITVRFFPGKAPNHVKNFIDLAESGFYNGTKFHRVIPGFMIQGGDPNTKSGSPNSWGTGDGPRRLKAEFSDIHHKRGILSMARSTDPDSASSQFFITVADAGFLDKQYTVFGEVLSGMDVADKIVSAPHGANDRPNNPTSIEKVVIREAKPGEIK